MGIVGIIIFLILVFLPGLLNDRSIDIFNNNVDNLSVDDFIFTIQSCTGKVVVANDKNIALAERVHLSTGGKDMLIDGSSVYEICIPLCSTEENDNLSEYIPVFSSNCYTIITVSEDCYKKYLEAIEDVYSVQTKAFVLTAKLKDENSLAHKRILYPSKFMTERYNLLNLVTVAKPYNSDDYEEFLSQIKECLLSEWRMKK